MYVCTYIHIGVYILYKLYTLTQIEFPSSRPIRASSVFQASNEQSGLLFVGDAGFEATSSRTSSQAAGAPEC